MPDTKRIELDRLISAVCEAAKRHGFACAAGGPGEALQRNAELKRAKAVLIEFIEFVESLTAKDQEGDPLFVAIVPDDPRPGFPFETWGAEQMEDPAFRAAMVKIAMKVPEVQALVEAAEFAHYMFAEQLRVLFGSFPDVDVSNENDIMIRLRAALAPFEVT